MRKLPESPKDVFSRSLFEFIVFEFIITLAKIFKFWEKPYKRASGDLETMTFLDKVYWLYKTQNPIDKPEDDLNLEKAIDINSKVILLDDSASEILTLSAVGDLLNHPYLSNSENTLYQSVQKELFGNDLCMANLECCINNNLKNKLEFSTKKGPLLTFNYQEFDIVKGGFNFLSTACNHSFDFNKIGISTTINKLNEKKIKTNGMNICPEDAEKGTIIELKKFKIGIISYTFGLNGHKLPPEEEFLVNTMKLNNKAAECDFSKVIKQTEFLRYEQCDFIIAHLHWGWEHELYPRASQKEIATHLAELGIDLIIGHHPHVIQPTTLYQTKRDKERIVPIFYSLGNLTNGFSKDFLCQSLLAKISLTKINNKTLVKEIHTKIINQEVSEKNKTMALKIVKRNISNNY